MAAERTASARSTTTCSSRSSSASAARTSAFSRRWRESNLWRHLPELSFRGIAYGTLTSALAQVALPKVILLDIDIPDQIVPAQDVASLLRTAARLDPVELNFAIHWLIPMPIQVPSFARAASIKLSVNYYHLSPPKLVLCGEFPVLERLSITAGHFDIGALISRCPHLRVLELTDCQGLDTVTVHSVTIKELLVISDRRLRGVDIVAPVLKKFTLQSQGTVEFSMSLLAPTVENLSWKCRSPWWYGSQDVIGIDGTWCLYQLMIETEESGFVLALGIARPSQDCVIHVRNLQEMFQFPNISVLDICLWSRGHVYGAVMLQLLRVCSAVKRLKLVIQRNTWRNEACTPNCPCDQPQNWRSQNISLTGLEGVEIESFKGSDHEVDFLKLLFRCARLTKVTVTLAPYVVVASSKGCKEAYNIFMENPIAECRVYRKRGKEVIYA